MAKWAAATDVVLDRGFGGSRQGRKIEGAILHHVAGTDGRGYVASANSRDSHPTYHVGRDGSVAGIVHPDRRPFSTSHSVDNVAITFEIDNAATGGDWPVTDAALSAVVEVCVDHARQAGLTKAAVNTPGRDQPGVFFIGWHSQYMSTACPGPYVRGKIGWIVDEVNRRLAGGAASNPATKPVSQSAPAPAPSGGVPSQAQWRTIQDWLKRLGRYGGPVDGVPGENTWKGIQTTVTKYGYYHGPIDGIPGVNTYKGMQSYARDGGGYTGPVDGVLGPNSWAGFIRRLSS